MEYCIRCGLALTSENKTFKVFFRGREIIICSFCLMEVRKMNLEEFDKRILEEKLS